MTAEPQHLLAELEIFHSRPIAPTRRISIGRTLLPAACDDSNPGFGILLLGSVCSRFGPDLPPELLGEVAELVHDLEQGRPVPQPRLRHRLQQDRVGLARSRQKLWGRAGSGTVDDLVCDFESSRASPSQIVLGAVYAAGFAAAPPRGEKAYRDALRRDALRGELLRAVRRGLAWRGEVGPPLFSYLAAGRSSSRPVLAPTDPVGWALEVLGFDRGVDQPARAAVRRGFRDALRAAHPDLGAAEAEAADRIAELSEARRILLAR